MSAQKPLVKMVNLPPSVKVADFPKLVFFTFAGKSKNEYLLFANGNYYTRMTRGNAVWEKIASPQQMAGLTDTGEEIYYYTLNQDQYTTGATAVYRSRFELFRRNGRGGRDISVHSILLEKNCSFVGNCTAIHGKYHIVDKDVLYFLPDQGSGQRLYSTDGGATWQDFTAIYPTNIRRAGNRFICTDDAHLYISGNAAFEQADTVLLPAMLTKDQYLIESFGTNDTISLVTATGGVWNYTKGTGWYIQQIPDRVSGFWYSAPYFFIQGTKGWQRSTRIEGPYTPVIAGKNPFCIGYTWYAMTNPGEWLLSTPHAGLWRSADNGDTWQPFSEGLPRGGQGQVRRIGKRLFSSDIDKPAAFWFSDDGSKWQAQEKPLPLTQCAHDLVFGDTLSFSISLKADSAALFSSEDGIHWNACHTLKTFSKDGTHPNLMDRQHLILNDAPYIRVFDLACGEELPAFRQPEPNPVQLSWAEMQYHVVQSGDTMLVFQTNRLWRTTDRGQQWVLVPTPSASVQTQQNAHYLCTYKGQLLFIDSSLQIWQSDDWGSSWVLLAEGIKNSSWTNFTIHNEILFACSDNNLYATTAPGKHWVEVHITPMVLTAFSFLDREIYYSYVTYEGIYKTDASALLNELDQISDAKVPQATAAAVTIQPNPAQTRFTVACTGVEKQPVGLLLSVRDALGRLVDVRPLVGPHTTVDCADWTPGLYFVHIANESNTVWTGKVQIR